MYGKGLRALSIAAVLVLATATALIFFYAPLDADQGVIQKILYVHVPLAIVSLGGFIAGAIFAIRHLRSGERSWDMRSYVAIHLSIVFAVGALATGSIWARASWGHWWVWNEPVLVSFLIVFLLYCCYQPLRFSIGDPERQARYASVFAIAAGAFVPINFIAVRLATPQVHPRVAAMSAPMELTFYLSIAGIALLFATLWKLELTTKGAKAQLARLRAQLDPEPGEGDHKPAPVASAVAVH
ncbi:MAG: cytochrome c biogenesis protein [Thermoleophilaceae bacterium]